MLIFLQPSNSLKSVVYFYSKIKFLTSRMEQGDILNFLSKSGLFFWVGKLLKMVEMGRGCIFETEFKSQVIFRANSIILMFLCRRKYNF